MLPETAVGIVAQGVMQAGTVTQWDAVWGARAANVSLTPPAVANQPAWNATGGPGGGPCVVFDGVDDVLRDAVLGLWGYGPAAVQLDVWGFVPAGEAAGDVMLRFTAPDNVTAGVNGTPILRGGMSGVGAVNVAGTTNIGGGIFRRLTAQAISNGNFSVFVQGALDAANANTHAPWADGGGLSLGASAAAATPTALTCVAWALSYAASATAPLSSDQSAYLQALVKNYVPGLV